METLITWWWSTVRWSWLWIQVNVKFIGERLFQPEKQKKSNTVWHSSKQPAANNQQQKWEQTACFTAEAMLVEEKVSWIPYWSLTLNLEGTWDWRGKWSRETENLCILFCVSFLYCRKSICFSSTAQSVFWLLLLLHILYIRMSCNVELWETWFVPANRHPQFAPSLSCFFHVWCPLFFCYFSFWTF